MLRDFRHARESHFELQEAAKKKGEKIAKLLADHGANWWSYYELRFEQHVALMAIRLGWGDELKRIACSSNPTREFLAFATDEEDNGTSPLLGMSEAGQAAFLNLLIGIFYSMEAIGYFSLSIHELLARAREGDTASLLHAVSIDPCTLGTATAQQIVATRQLSRDKRFFSGLYKRMKSPHAALRQYVELRYFERILRDAGALSGTRKEDLLDLVADLGLYSTKGADPVKGLTALFADWEQRSTSRN